MTPSCFMTKILECVPVEKIRRIVFLSGGRIAVIPKHLCKDDNGSPVIHLFDNRMNLIALLDRNEGFDGAKLDVIELQDGRFLSYGRSYYLKLWDRSGKFIEEWNNHFFVRSVLQLSCGRIITASAGWFLIRDKNGLELKRMKVSEYPESIDRCVELPGERFMTVTTLEHKNIWSFEGELEG